MCPDFTTVHVFLDLTCMQCLDFCQTQGTLRQIEESRKEGGIIVIWGGGSRGEIFML